MRKSFVTLLLLMGATASMANLAFAGIDNEVGEGLKLMNAQMAQELKSRVAKLRTSGAKPDSIYIGYSPLYPRSGSPADANYWKVGRGDYRPPAPGGYWDWETPVAGDSLQGWWPLRELHTNFSGNRTDNNRPWTCIDHGNNANYVINQSRAVPGGPGFRTFGVVGVWHRDPGNTGVGAGRNVSWTPLGGSFSDAFIKKFRKP